MSDSNERSTATDSSHTVNRRGLLLGGTALAAASVIASVASVKTAKAQQQPAAPGGKPNILVIFGDDIGISNISAYSHGLMGYSTPNIDRIGREGIMFLHYYGEQSCTAGRAAFLTGQHGIRTGLTKVGFPGAPMGMSQKDPSIGGLLKILVTPRGNLARTMSVTAMTRCRRSMASMNSSATFTISTLKKSRNCRTTRKIRPTSPSLVHAASSSARQRRRTTPRSIRASERSANRPSRILVRSPRSVWRRSMTRHRPLLLTS